MPFILKKSELYRMTNQLSFLYLVIYATSSQVVSVHSSLRGVWSLRVGIFLFLRAENTPIIQEMYSHCETYFSTAVQ